MGAPNAVQRDSHERDAQREETVAEGEDVHEGDRRPLSRFRQDLEGDDVDGRVRQHHRDPEAHALARRRMSREGHEARERRQDHRQEDPAHVPGSNDARWASVSL